MSRAGHGLAFQRRNMHAEYDSIIVAGGEPSALLEYAMIAAADPKAPAEFRAMGPTVWAIQFALVTGTMYVVDPLRIREGGLDDDWYSGFNPIFTWPGKLWEGATGWIPERAPWWLGSIDE